MAINNEDQQFCLRWNNFQAYITSQFETLRDDEEFVDVTLACEGQRLGAHKVVLSACSPFFKELFKTNPCSHPIIFMRDVELQHVMALLEFMYAGEVNVAQQNLSGFLKTAESLQIRGLTDASKDQQENEHYPPNTPTPYPPTQCIKKKPEPKQSPTRLVTQDKREAPVSPVPRKRSKTDLEDTDRLTDSETDVKHQKSEDSSINPFALVPSKIHTEIDISQELIEPKLELPDYSEEDTSHDESQNFIDVNDTNNSYATSTGGPDTVPGTSGAVDPSLESQAYENQKLHSLDPRPCSMCGRVYSNLSNLRQHVRLIHNPTHVTCPICNKTFKSSLYLKRHLVTCRYHHGQTKFTVKQLLSKIKTQDEKDSHACYIDKINHFNNFEINTQIANENFSV